MNETHFMYAVDGTGEFSDVKSCEILVENPFFD